MKETSKRISRAEGGALKAGLALTLALGMMPPAPTALAEEGQVPPSQASERASLDSLQRDAGESQGVATVNGLPYGSLEEAFAAAAQADAPATVLLQADVADCPTITIGPGSKVTLDLNGNTVTFASSKRFTVQGSLTVKDSVGNGGIEGTSARLVETSGSSASFTLESGSVESSSIAIQVRDGSSFVMTGGSVVGANGVYLLSGSATILGGEVRSATATSKAVYAGRANVSLQIGDASAEDSPYVESIQVVSGTLLALNAGTVGAIYGTLPSSVLEQGNFNVSCETDFSAALPAGYGAFNEGDGWVLRALDETNASAKVERGDGVSYWGSAAAAAAALEQGDTLVLLGDVDVSGDQAILVSVPNVTVDLNGHDVRNSSTGNKTYGVRINAKGAGTVVLKNSSAEAASVYGTGCALRASTNSSLAVLTLEIEGDIELSSPGQPLDLGYAVVPYSDSAAAAIGNGGFAANVGGEDFIYGSLSAAMNALDDAGATGEDRIVKLLNDYKGYDTLAVSANRSLIVDLNGKTFTSAASSAVSVNGSNSTLELRNGKVVCTAAAPQGDDDLPCVASILNGIEPGVSGGVVPYTNSTLTFDGVDLSMASDVASYGIVVNGLDGDITVNLKDSTVSVGSLGAGIYFPCADSSLNVVDSDVTGGTGIAVKGGVVNVSGSSTVTGTGAAKDPGEGTQSGFVDTGAAVYVEGNYGDRTAVVNIENGKFVSVNGRSVLLAAETGEEKAISVEGGSFSDPVPAEHLGGDLVNYRSNADASAPFVVVTEKDASGSAAAKVQDGDEVIYFYDADDARQFAASAGIEDDGVEVAKCKVTFDDRVESTEDTVAEVDKNGTVTHPENPTRAGYAFGGWYSDEGCTVAYDFNAPVRGDMTLYAKWNASVPSLPTAPSYDVAVEETEHGVIAVSPKKAKEGDVVTVTATANEGFVLDEIVVLDEDGDAVELTKGEGDAWTFKMPGGDVTVAAEFACDGGALCPSCAFTDMGPATEWYHGAVDWAVENGVLHGIGGTTLMQPNEPITRAQMATVLYNVEGGTAGDAAVMGNYADADANAWYAPMLSWAVEEGLFSGWSEDGVSYLAPDRAITREEAAAVLMRWAESSGEDVAGRADLSSFPDDGEVSGWAGECMSWAVEAGVLQGVEQPDGTRTLDPQGDASRAQVAALMQRLAG